MSDQTGAGASGMNTAFADPTAFSMNPEIGTRSDFTESASLATGDLVEMPQDVGVKRETGETGPARRAEGGATYDPSSQMTSQARQGVHNEAEVEQAKTLPRVDHPVSRPAIEDYKDEVGSVGSRIESAVPQTRNF
ncbi:hypothetical protein OBBRIDRAFT_153201 [Obba rivulosa]|uniref:Uncharacterized protein n=1 Tax=Obba rivulosa TaxID=1052685 RepID=A0A8E2DGW4_9APHY|nr:hypothetical protein OBBRIDRAFT_153201 [Obba rivulosa]